MPTASASSLPSDRRPVPADDGTKVPRKKGAWTSTPSTDLPRPVLAVLDTLHGSEEGLASRLSGAGLVVSFDALADAAKVVATLGRIGVGRDQLAAAGPDGLDGPKLAAWTREALLAREMATALPGGGIVLHADAAPF